MSAEEFRVGDRVKIIQTGYGFGCDALGYEGLITHISRDGYYGKTGYVFIPDHPMPPHAVSNTGFASGNSFELISRVEWPKITKGRFTPKKPQQKPKRKIVLLGSTFRWVNVYMDGNGQLVTPEGRMHKTEDSAKKYGKIGLDKPSWTYVQSVRVEIKGNR